MRLGFSIRDAEPYVIGDLTTLEDAIEAESYNVMSEANADHLEDNTDECREALRARVVREATAALRAPGDEYRDPIGVLWVLTEKEGEA